MSLRHVVRTIRMLLFGASVIAEQCGRECRAAVKRVFSREPTPPPPTALSHQEVERIRRQIEQGARDHDVN